MERSFIAWAALQTAKLPQVELGIGDDAALLAGSNQSTVVTCDSLCEGTHFISKECGLRAVGRKVAGVNLSDIAAMGGRAEALFLSFCLPHDQATIAAQEIFLGVKELCEPLQVAIAGGDTNTWDGPLVVHATAIGRVEQGRAWRRAGAQKDDLIVVSGSLGGSILGKHLSFEPRLQLAAEIRKLLAVNAACDISDGLGSDLLNICAASRCGAELDLAKIPISDAAHELSARDGKPALEHAIGDGEDFELLFTVPSSQREQIPSAIGGVPLTIIGKVVSRTGLWTRTQDGKIKQVPPNGYQH